MLLLRAACFYAAIGILAIIYSLPCILLGFFSRKTSYTIARNWCRCAIYLLRAFCGLQYRIHGSIPQQPVIYACNHQSAWECIVLMVILPQPNFVIKRELLWIPFWGWGYASVRPIAIKRANKIQSLRQLIAQSRQKLDSGESVVIFPEGTRCPPGQCGSMYSSYAMVAADSGYPVVPVAHNSGWFWRRQEFIKREGCIDIHFGAPITANGKKTSQIAKETESWLKKEVAALPQA